MSKDWYQQALTPPDVIECRVLIGLVPSSQHAQAMVELSDPVTGVLVAQWSSPHVHSDNWQQLLDAASEKARQYIADTHDPF